MIASGEVNPVGEDTAGKTSGRHMPALLTLVAALISGELAWAAAGTNPHAWQRWEHSLASTRSHDNPYADVTL